MPAPTLTADSSLTFFLDEAIYTHARAKAHPLAVAYAADFDNFFVNWKIVNEQEINFHTAIVQCNALIAACDDELDSLVDAVQQAVLLETKNDRKAPLFFLYFGAKRPHELKRPVLGGQLETMRGWIPSLLASSNPVLAALGAKVAHKVAAADVAVASQAKAEQQNRDFRTIGARKALLDSLNAIRKAIYGKLSELPHANPAQHLPATFAEPFFRHDSSGKSAPLTSAELTLQVSNLQSQLTAAQAQLATALAEDANVAKAKSDSEATDVALAQAEKDVADALAKVAALKGKKKS